MNYPFDTNPFLTIINRENLRHHIVLPEKTLNQFKTIQQEYQERDKLAHYGLPYKRKILLYGNSGCGKTLSAEYLAWQTGLPMIKVRFDMIMSSGDIENKLRMICEEANKQPYLLFFDKCDYIAKTTEDLQQVGQDLGEIKRVVDTFLQFLDDFDCSKGLLVVSATFTASLIKTVLCRRVNFDETIHIPLPTKPEIETLLKQTLATIATDIINWEELITKNMISYSKQTMFNSAQVIKIAQNTAKNAILNGKTLITQDSLEYFISQEYDRVN